MEKKIFGIDLSTEEKRKELYNIFNTFKFKKDVFEYFGVVRNTSNLEKIKQICEEIGFDWDIYRKRKYETTYCLNCGKEIQYKGDHRKKFCNSSCAASYNNKKRSKNKGKRELQEEALRIAEGKIDKTIITEIREINGNHKSVGERGQRIAIGELAKFDIDVLLPMSDNLPFDFVVIYNNEFYKCQVKTTASKTANNSISFKLTTNNWYSKTKHKYTKDEVDVFILCDLTNIYLVRYDESENKSFFMIRNDIPKNKQFKNVKFASDYIISKNRIAECFKK